MKNEERFTGKAEDYKKFRPTYPKELFDYLFSQIGFSRESIVADVGSGTGIFSRLLLGRGSRVYGVEPNEDMRQTAGSDLGEFENFTSVNAPAENTGIQKSSVDFITAAQSFHWFDMQTFKYECKRILKPGGRVVVVWNVRDYKHEIVDKDYNIREKYCIDTKGLGTKGMSRTDMGIFFLDGIFECKTYNNDLRFDKESFIGRNLSASYAPKEEASPEKYHGLIGELSKLFDEYSSNGMLIYPHFTECYIGRV